LLGFSGKSSHNKPNKSDKPYNIALCFVQDRTENKRFTIEQFVHYNKINHKITDTLKIFNCYLFVFRIKFLDKETYYFLKPRSSI